MGRNKKEKICGIYKIENIINGKVYIGSSINIYKRWKEHINALKNGIHHSFKLQRAWNKYGKDNFKFEIVEEFNGDVTELRKLEQYYLDLFISYYFSYGYNISANSFGGGASPVTYKDICDGKCSISKDQFDKILYYLCNTEIPIPKISELTGVHYRSIYQIYFKENYNDIVKDITFIKRKYQGEPKLTEKQVLEIISMLLNKKYMIDIAREYGVNLSTIWDIYNYKTWKHLTKNINFLKYERASGRGFKPINQYDLEGNFIATYKSAREAEKETGIGYKMISRVCKGERPYTHGYVWKFAS